LLLRRLWLTVFPLLLAWYTLAQLLLLLLLRLAVAKQLHFTSPNTCLAATAALTAIATATDAAASSAIAAVANGLTRHLHPPAVNRL
jgi:hypothetical protein